MRRGLLVGEGIDRRRGCSVGGLGSSCVAIFDCNCTWLLAFYRGLYSTWASLWADVRQGSLLALLAGLSCR